ncbi:hypothetical protein HGM15179_018459 [Zosterops borbonicus]|uniref:Uncharacterized protein n=1 Tax=Zosterops borbonicus TaxID=364589 RepID=A0A8K1FZ03_9PASS|nr:hypothetical protein HGM15179_018459 [Zosterops borbonicus]
MLRAVMSPAGRTMSTVPAGREGGSAGSCTDRQMETEEPGEAKEAVAMENSSCRSEPLQKAQSVLSRGQVPQFGNPSRRLTEPLLVVRSGLSQDPD